MRFRSIVRYVWLAVGIFSLILLGFHWMGYESTGIQTAILFLNALCFIMSLPCSLFFVPIAVSANHFMGIAPLSGDGIYLNTLFLFVVGAMQWFWIARFWSPTEPQVQSLGLPGR